MIFVGLMGGASYVNVQYFLLKFEGIQEYQKELAMNISGVFNDVGITLSAVFCFILDNVWIKK